MPKIIGTANASESDVSCWYQRTYDAGGGMADT